MPRYIATQYPDLTKLSFWDDFVGNTVNHNWTFIGTGGVTLPNELGGHLKIVTVTSNYCIMNFGNVGPLSVAGHAKVTWRGKMTPAVAAGGLCQCGLHDVTNPLTYFIRWIYEPNANANFRCTVKAGGTETIVSSAISADNLNHDFKIECMTGSILFYLDGTLRATITTNIPTTQLQPYAGCVAAAAANSEINMDWVWCLGDRA